jgi:nitroreductase
METWDALRARRNVREYDSRPISAEDLDRILEAGRLAPSASNRQKWDFVVTTDKAQLEALSKVLAEPEAERYRTIDQYDLGQATMAMMLAATDLGIGSGHSAVGDQEACRAIFGIPEGYIPAYMIALGYPAGKPLAPLKRHDRRPLDDVVHRGHW